MQRTATDSTNTVSGAYYSSAIDHLENIVGERSSNQQEFNVKMYDYGGEMQMRVYKKPVKYGQGKKRKKSELEEDKETYTRDQLYAKLESNEIELGSKKMQNYIDKINRSLTVSMNRAKNKVYEYARANTWEWFVTLTFDPKKIDSTDYDLVSAKVSQWLKDMRKRYAKDMKYIVVPELHADGKKYHFHALMTNIGNMKMVDSGNRTPSGTIYNLGNYKLGFTTATKITDTYRASNYLSKYITKTLCLETRDKKRYWASRNLDTPSITAMNLPEDEIKKILDSVKNQVTHTSTVDIDFDGFTQSVDYYEISISE